MKSMSVLGYQKKWTLPFILLLSSFQWGYAAKQLSWQECINETIRNNSELKSAYQTFYSSEFSARGAYNNFFPQLSASLNYNHGTTNTATTATGGASTFFSGSVSNTFPRSLER